MARINAEIGKHLGRLLERFFDHLPEFQRIKKELGEGNLDGAVGIFRESLRNSDVMIGLQGAAQQLYGADPERMQGYFAGRDFGGAIDYLGSLIPDRRLAQPTLSVAQALCGSTILYKDRHAVIAQTSAWHRIGGEDQTVPEAAPGTMGVYHSSGRGGYDITMLSAHVPGGAGIVCLEHLILLPEGTMERGKTRVAEITGFKELHGKNIEDPSLPIALKFRNMAPVSVVGRSYQVVPAEAEQELRLGGYKLQRA